MIAVTEFEVGPAGGGYGGALCVRNLKVVIASINCFTLRLCHIKSRIAQTSFLPSIV